MVDDVSDRNSKWIIYLPVGKQPGPEQRKQRLYCNCAEEELSPTFCFTWQWTHLGVVGLGSKHLLWSPES